MLRLPACGAAVVLRAAELSSRQAPLGSPSFFPRRCRTRTMSATARCCSASGSRPGCASACGGSCRRATLRPLRRRGMLGWGGRGAELRVQLSPAEARPGGLPRRGLALLLTSAAVSIAHCVWAAARPLQVQAFLLHKLGPQPAGGAKARQGGWRTRGVQHGAAHCCPRAPLVLVLRRARQMAPRLGSADHLRLAQPVSTRCALSPLPFNRP